MRSGLLMSTLPKVFAACRSGEGKRWLFCSIEILVLQNGCTAATVPSPASVMLRPLLQRERWF